MAELDPVAILKRSASGNSGTIHEHAIGGPKILELPVAPGTGDPCVLTRGIWILKPHIALATATKHSPSCVKLNCHPCGQQPRTTRGLGDWRNCRWLDHWGRLNLWS